MPPPPVPVTPIDTAALSALEVSHSISIPSDPGVDFPKGHRPGPRTSGFRPIGQNSAVKKFFPADDDDMDAIPDRYSHTSGPTPLPLPQEPTRELQASVIGKTQHEREEPDQYTNKPPSSRHHEDQSAASPPQKRIRPVSLREDPQISKDPRDDSWRAETTTPPWPPQIPDREGNGGIRPSTPPGYSAGELYSIISQVGEGTFGKVYKARNTITKVHVALKRIRMEAERDGFPVTAMREIKLLQSLRHGNVVQLYEMMVSNG
jgi:CTD kinase subunit alpha